MDTTEIRKRLTGLTAGEKVLAGFAALIVIAAVVLFAWTSFGGATLRQNDVSYNRQYQWSGDRLVLHNSEQKHSPTCMATPQRGERRNVGVPSQSVRRFAATRFVTLRPWFSGSASVTCTSTVTAYHGAGATRWLITSSLWFKAVCVFLIVVPLAIILVRGNARRRRASA